jgi:hypothetical protein
MQPSGGQTLLLGLQVRSFNSMRVGPTACFQHVLVRLTVLLVDCSCEGVATLLSARDLILFRVNLGGSRHHSSRQCGCLVFQTRVLSH